MNFTEDQELAVIEATMKLKLKPFGPNRNFHMASLAKYLRERASLDVSSEQLFTYFASIFDLGFLEARAAKNQAACSSPARLAKRPLIDSGSSSSSEVESGQEDVVLPIRPSVGQGGLNQANQTRPPKRSRPSTPPVSVSLPTSRSTTPRSATTRHRPNYKE